ncbi:hypothetical protein BpHYR1_003881, partial [Brachionus plicatilis]
MCLKHFKTFSHIIAVQISIRAVYEVKKVNTDKVKREEKSMLKLINESGLLIKPEDLADGVMK